jgi:DNA-directed RNA polymerase alpha subunit
VSVGDELGNLRISSPGIRRTLGERAYLCLRRAGIETLWELALWDDEALLALPYFGAGSLRRVHDALNLVIEIIDRLAQFTPPTNTRPRNPR